MWKVHRHIAAGVFNNLKFINKYVVLWVGIGYTPRLHVGKPGGWFLKLSGNTESMRIAIDARMIKTGSMHGIARYVYELIRGLSVLDERNGYEILVNRDSPLLDEEWPDHIRFTEIRSGWISFREQFEIPSVLKTKKIDLFHAPSFVAPLLTPCKMIMTIHDLNHLVLPQFYTPLHQIYYRVFVKSCIERSTSILTVSHFSKHEIVRTLGLDPSKIFVTYNGVSDVYKAVHDPAELAYIREIYELPDEFILCVSNNKPHKNVHQLVRAYCQSNIEIPLVLATPVDTALLRLAESFNKKHLIYYSKFIAEEHLPAIYTMTRLFVYPSTYEGFGLPPLEALCCGAPVVVARSSSLPEVVGDLAVFADPYDYFDIARALESGVNSDVSQRVAPGMIEAHRQKFSWRVMAEQTLQIYSKCLGEENSRLTERRQPVGMGDRL
jgi:glycosyltransferase involved in cell wall biosynthesis